MSTAPLQGLRVIDLGHYISAPLAGVFLADQGADVIQVCQPNKNSWCEHTEAILARGKRKIELNLKNEFDQIILHTLLREADVLLENFRPGVMNRLGLSDDALKALNPDLIVVSMPGYSRIDPRASEALTDAQVSAMCGLFTDLSIGGAGLKMPPTYTALSLPSVYAGLWAAVAALSAIYARQTKGGGAFVEVPLLDAAMSAAAGVIFQIKDQPARYNAPPITRRVLDRINLSWLPGAASKWLHGLVRRQMPPFFRNYICADGKELFICAIDNSNHIEKLLNTLELRDHALALGFVFGNVLDIPPTKNNINAYRGPSRKWKKLEQRVAAVLRKKTADEWTEVLLRAGVPASTQRSFGEWIGMPVMTDSGILWSTNAGLQPSAQVDVRGIHCSTSINPNVPGRFELFEYGWRTARSFLPPATNLDPSNSSIGPLDGLVVLDLANVIAGPCAGRTLAHLGAKVLHVSAVNPSMGPRMNLLLGAEVNQGKRSIALNLHTPEGQEILRRLLPSADVVIYNKLPKQAVRMGVTPEQVHAVNPKTVVTAVTAYSGVIQGGWEDLPSYDPVIQAVCGIMRRFGGESTPQVHGIASCIDYFTGFSGAFATLVGLMARLRGDQQLVARTSLIRTAAWVQLRQLAYTSPASAQAGGIDCLGNGEDEFLIKVRDGWIVVCKYPGRDVPLIEERLRVLLQSLTVKEALDWASNNNCLAGPIMRASDLRKTSLPNRDLTPNEGKSGEVEIVNHSAGVEMFLPKPSWLRWDNRTLPALSEAPLPGQHTAEILSMCGYDQKSIQELLNRGVVSSGWNGLHTYVPN